MTERGRRGADAEAAARDHLQRAGLRALAANAQFRVGELDLVMLERDARGEDVVVFVEVRYRGDPRYGGGAASVDIAKRRKLVAAALQFLAAHREYRDAPCRFDVVEASGDPRVPTLAWLRDAFRADDI